MPIESLKQLDNHLSIVNKGQLPQEKGEGTVSTFLDPIIGELPKRPSAKEFFSPENISEAINSALPGGTAVGEGTLLAKPIQQGSKIFDYLNPGKAAEEFRKNLGGETSKENINELSKIAQLAKSSREKEALIPKEKVYSQEGKSDVYGMSPASLPEENLPRFAEMINPSEQMNESQMNDLSKAIKQYRSGKVDKEIGGKPIDVFLHKAEDIFGIPELPEKAALKIEDALLMPAKRESAYFSDPDVASVYTQKGKLMQLHGKYENKPILENYDKLQSELKTKLREMEKIGKVDESAVPKIEQLKSNIQNLDKDANTFLETLPENMKGLVGEFRQKYKSYAETYKAGKKGIGPSQTLRNLAEGRSDLVNDEQVVKLFSNPTKADLEAIKDMGEGAARNAMYAALQRVKPNDAEGIATGILELKRTKGFDNIVTPEIENWANDMLKRVKYSGLIKKTLGSAGAGTIGGAMFGPAGAVAGLAAPWAKPTAELLIKKFRK